MKPNNRTCNAGCQFLLVFLALAFFITNVRAQTELLVGPAPIPGKAVNTIKREGLAKLPEFKRSRQVSINRQAFEQKSMVLNLFDDAKFNVIFFDVRKGDTSQFEANEIWSGKIENVPFSHVELYVYNDHVTGRVYTGAQLFTIENIDDGTALVIEIDKNKMIPEGDDVLLYRAR